jgi:TonB-dependent SusC/RagA subfamily outer membrane receptor
MKFKAITLIVFFVFSTGFSFSQRANKRITITGKVTDAALKPVAGAAIFIDKKKTNTVTDQHGNYRVKVRSDAKEILVFSLFNGASEEEINGRTTIDFILTGDPSVNTGKDEAADNKADNTEKRTDEKALQTEGGKVIDFQDSQYKSFQTIYDMIRGRFPGVEVSGTSIKVMGSSSLNVSTEPLFVVDGVIVNSIDDISPQTVKTIEVLKGPDATVYGIRGSNGVIVITRIKGSDIK